MYRVVKNCTIYIDRTAKPQSKILGSFDSIVDARKFGTMFAIGTNFGEICHILKDTDRGYKYEGTIVSGIYYNKDGTKKSNGIMWQYSDKFKNYRKRLNWNGTLGPQVYWW